MDTYSCDAPGCKKSYKTKINLKRHKDAMHGFTKKFQCTCCSKVLSSKQNLQEHLMTHSNEIPFVCKELGCGKRFRHGSQYSAHKRIHGNIRTIVEIRNQNIDLKTITQILALNECKNRKFRIDLGIAPNLSLPKILGPQKFVLPTI